MSLENFMRAVVLLLVIGLWLNYTRQDYSFMIKTSENYIGDHKYKHEYIIRCDHRTGEVKCMTY